MFAVIVINIHLVALVANVATYYLFHRWTQRHVSRSFHGCRAMEKLLEK